MITALNTDCDRDIQCCLLDEINVDKDADDLKLFCNVSGQKFHIKWYANNIPAAEDNTNEVLIVSIEMFINLAIKYYDLVK